MARVLARIGGVEGGVVEDVSVDGDGAVVLHAGAVRVALWAARAACRGL